MNNLRDVMLLTNEVYESWLQDSGAVPVRFGARTDTAGRRNDPSFAPPREIDLTSGVALIHR